MTEKMWLDLTEDELATLDGLRDELGLQTIDQAVHALIRQAFTRSAIVCPACGHSARLESADVARCERCLSILQLTDQIWQLAATRPPN